MGEKSAGYSSTTQGITVAALTIYFGALCAAWPAPSPSVAPAEQVTVHIVPHTHDDVGWLKTPDQ